MKSFVPRLTHYLLLLCWLLGQNLLAQIHTYKHFSHKEGLTLSATCAILEKKDGGILIGTMGAGIVEYDGYQFHDVIKSTSNIHHHVTGLQLYNDKIYFSSKFSGLYYVGPHKEAIKVFSLPTSDEYQHLYRANDILYLVTTKKLYTYNITTKKSKEQVFGDPTKHLVIYDIFPSSNGMILFTNKGNYIINEKEELLSLNSYFNKLNIDFNQFLYAYEYLGKLRLFKADFTEAISLDFERTTVTYTVHKITSDINPKQINQAIFNSYKKCFAILLDDGTIYEEKFWKLSKVQSNYKVLDKDPNRLIADRKGAYWMTTQNYGIIKVSHLPFTKLNFHKVYDDHRILFVYRTWNDNVLLSTSENQTYCGSMLDGNLTTYPFKAYSYTNFNGKLYLGTSKGVYTYDSIENTMHKVLLPAALSDKKIHFIYYQAPYFWVSSHGLGLHQLDENFNLIARYNTNIDAPLHIFTAQTSGDKKYLYLGTALGVVRFNLATKEFKLLSSHNMGAYAGLSAVDTYGTIWFTLDAGLLGVSSRGELFTLSDPSIFPSFLFYTFNTDKYGHLVLGTNKGLTSILVNEKGKVINHTTYASGRGFDGYETNMRASHQLKDEVLMGTLEGLFLVDLRQLEGNNPPAPFVSINPLEHVDKEESQIAFRFYCKNPTIKSVRYTYRIANYSDKWSDLTEETLLKLGKLPSGNYILEVKATYDGIVFSETTTVPFQINVPFLRDNNLVYGAFILVLILIFLFYNRAKKNVHSQLFYAEQILLTQRFAPYLILFGLLAYLIANEIAPFMSSDLTINNYIVLTGAAVIFILFLLSVLKKDVQNLRRNLVLAFFVITLANIYHLYETSLHPFYGFSLILIGSISPIVFTKLLDIIIYAITFILLNLLVIYYSDGANYDKYLLIITIVISGLLSVIVNMIRYDSFEQLAFISSILNKSDMVALAMNEDGKVIYASKNIGQYIEIEGDSLLNQPISTMNKFIPRENEFRKIDLNKEFKDGKRFIAPLVAPNGDLTWFEWTSKLLDDGLRVIIGQNITEKKQMQTTYEIIVENAEDIIYRLDQHGVLQFANQQLINLLGKPLNQLIGQPIMQNVPEEHQAILWENYHKQLTEKREIFYFVAPLYNHSSDVHWFEHKVSVMHEIGDKTKITGFLGVARDITDRLEKDTIIEAQRTDILASINYAQRIQRNILPREDDFKEFFDETFVIFQPKDTISDNFYQCISVNNLTYVILGDGIGRGIPGAFLSVISTKILQTIIAEKQSIDPGRILNEFDATFKRLLSENKEEAIIFDSIEMTVCVFDHENSTLYYACAGTRICIHDGKSFSIRKGDSKIIGRYQDEFQGYVTHHLPIDLETTIYLFTNGFMNELSEISNKKYSLKRMLELFTQNVNLPLSSQKENILADWKQWKGKSAQNDDFTIIGLRKNKSFKW